MKPLLHTSSKLWSSDHAHLLVLTQHMYVMGREPEGLVGTKLVNKGRGNFWEGIQP